MNEASEYEAAEKMNRIFDNDKVDTFLGKVIANLIPELEQVTKAMWNDFYSEIISYSYEHYNNIEDDVKRRLMRDFVNDYAKDPDNGKFKDIRESLWTEHRDEIMESLLKDGIEEELRRVFQPSNDYPKYPNFLDSLSKWVVDNLTTLPINWDSSIHVLSKINEYGINLKRLQQDRDDCVDVIQRQNSHVRSLEREIKKLRDELEQKEDTNE